MRLLFFFGVLVVMMHLALGVRYNDCGALGVVVVMNILFNKFMKIKRERV